MNNDHPANRDVTKKDLILALIAVVILFVPITLLFLIPEQPIVAKIFGGGKVVLIWGLIILILYLRKLIMNKVFNMED